MTDGNGRRPFRSLDPASADEAYWERFRGIVMERSAPELARRRSAAARARALASGDRLPATPSGRRDPTVEELIVAWRRSLVPAALVAAGLAAASLLADDLSEAIQDGALPAAAGVEEILLPADGGSVLVNLGSDHEPDAESVLYAVEGSP